MAKKLKGSAPVTPGLPPFHIRTLEQLYALSDRRQVVRYLEDHPFLVLTLVEAYTQIAVRFPHARLILAVVAAPEAPEADEATTDDEYLMLSIVTPSDQDDATDLLDQLVSGEWWQQAQSQVKGKLRITVEPR